MNALIIIGLIIAAFVVGVILAARVLVAVKALHADFMVDAEAVHARLATIEKSIKGTVKKL